MLGPELIDFLVLTLWQRSGSRREGGGGAIALPIFGRSVNPFPTRGARICPPHSYRPNPPKFVVDSESL